MPRMNFGTLEGNEIETFCENQALGDQILRRQMLRTLACLLSFRIEASVDFVEGMEENTLVVCTSSKYCVKTLVLSLSFRTVRRNDELFPCAGGGGGCQSLPG